MGPTSKADGTHTGGSDAANAEGDAAAADGLRAGFGQKMSCCGMNLGALKVPGSGRTLSIISRKKPSSPLM